MSKDKKQDVFPCWKYHATKKPIIVNSQEELDTLGAGWENSPAYFEKAKEEDKTYLEHMGEWESKADKKVKKGAK